MIAASDRRAHAGLDTSGATDSGASLLPGLEECAPAPGSAPEAAAEADTGSAPPVVGSKVGPEPH